MQNGITTLYNLFTTNIFQIPQYQRAFSWERTHLKAFIDDLRQQVKILKKFQDKRYFLGTLLLHEADNSGDRPRVNIVDGQQRLTTSVVFIATALNLAKNGIIKFNNEKEAALLRRTFIYDDVSGLQIFHTIEEDDPFFQSAILKISNAINNLDSPSGRRLSVASKLFEKEVQPNEWEDLIIALKNSQIMIYAVTTPGEATQIFEFQNDRGKKLTDLEALKSYIMHTIYLNSDRPDDRLSAIQTQFSKIFRLIESVEGIERAPKEDAVLAYHCASYTKWSKDEWRNPKQQVKTIIDSLDRSNIISWIEGFVSGLLESYTSIKNLFKDRDLYIEFSELLVLNRMAPFWPIILKAWKFDRSVLKKDFRKTCRLLEIYSFKGYAMSNLRSDTSLKGLYAKARDLTATDFDKLYNYIFALCGEYNIDEKFSTALNNQNLYDDDRVDGLYLLWKYENSLRNKTGQKQPQLSWKDFIEPDSYAAKFSLEHIAAKSNPIAEIDVKWDKKKRPFKEIALNRLGNLVIDSISSNSKKGKGDFVEKLTSLSELSSYLSQGELINYAKGSSKKPKWTVDSVKSRQLHLVNFAINNWDQNKYHTADNIPLIDMSDSSVEVINENPLEGDDIQSILD